MTTPTDRIRGMLGIKDINRKTKRTSYQYKGIEYVAEMETGVGRILIGYPLVGTGLAAIPEFSGRFVVYSERISDIDLEVLREIARKLNCKLL